MTNNIINAAMALITMWIVYKYSKISFERKPARPWLSLIFWGIFFVFQNYVESQKGKVSFIIFFLNILFVFIIIMSEYKGTIQIKVIKIIFFYVMWMLIEYFTEAFVDYLKIEENESVIVGSVLSKIIMVVLLQLLNRKTQTSNKKMPWNYWIILFTIPAGSIYISYILYLSEKLEIEYIENYNIIAFILLIFMNITIFEIYDKLINSLEIETENKIFEQQLFLLENSSEEKKKVYDEFRLQQHDYINQIIAVKSYIQQGKNEQAVEHLDDLLDICSDNIHVISQSGNDIIDSIINYKYSIAKKVGIDFSVQFFIPEKLPFRQRDICVIIGNALDNSIEAAQRSQIPYVKIFSGIKKEAFIIVIKNSFTGELKKDEKGNLQTRKKDKKIHGYGLRSIKKAVEKYQGQVIIDTVEFDKSKEKEFILTIILNLKSIEF